MKWWREFVSVGVAGLAVFLGVPVPAMAQEITVAAAADLNFALKEIAQRYEAKTGTKIKLTFGSSGNFFTAIQNGAPYDVYFSADVEYPKQLEAAGLAEPGTLYEYAVGRLVLWAPEDSPLDLTLGMKLLGDARVRKIAIANPKHAPYGRAAVSAMKAAGVYEKAEPKLVLDSLTTAQKGTLLYEHAFYEAASIRKFDDLYYLIYSSGQNNELAYATSQYPDRDFVCRGVIISNADLGLNGNTLPKAPAGTIHGGIEKISGQFYIFYHRCTHGTDFSRQACAEPIEIEPDGTIRQVEITSCGLNGKLLDGRAGRKATGGLPQDGLRVKLIPWGREGGGSSLASDPVLSRRPESDSRVPGGGGQ